MKIFISLSSKIVSAPVAWGDMKGKRYTLGKGHIDVVESKWSPTSHSIVEFLVDESERGKGIGGQLLDHIITIYGAKLSGAFSSKESLTLAYNRGFRGLGDNKHLDLNGLERERKSDSSVTLSYTAGKMQSHSNSKFKPRSLQSVSSSVPEFPSGRMAFVGAATEELTDYLTENFSGLCVLPVEDLLERLCESIQYFRSAKERWEAYGNGDRFEKVDSDGQKLFKALRSFKPTLDSHYSKTGLPKSMLKKIGSFYGYGQQKDLSLPEDYGLTDSEVSKAFSAVLKIAENEDYQKAAVNKAKILYMADYAGQAEDTAELDLGFESAISGYVYAHSYVMENLDLLSSLEHGCSKIHDLWCERTDQTKENAKLFKPYQLLMERDKEKDRVFLKYILKSILTITKNLG